MSYATVTDVATRLGRPITDAAEIAQVQAWLTDLTSIIRGRIPNIDDLVTGGSPSVETMVRIESNAIIRKIRNPEGYVSETVDDYTYRYNEQVRRGDLFLTDEEWADLTPSAVTRGAFTIRPQWG